MSFYSLLDASAKTTAVVKWISVVAVVLLLGVIALIAFLLRGEKKYDAKRLAFAGVSVGLSFALSILKVSPVLYGGSITLASFVPLLVYAYVFGVGDGLLVGLIHGLLNFISSPYILTPMTFVLDYLLAFASIGVMGLAPKFTEKTTFNVVLGTIAVFAVRFVFHFVSGAIYFAEGAIWVEFPAWAVADSFIYSFVYQCLYIPADCIIAAVALYVLAKTRVLDRIVKIMRPEAAQKTAI